MHNQMATGRHRRELTRWQLRRVIAFWALLVTAGVLLAACQPLPATSLPPTPAPSKSLPAEVTAADAMAKRDQGAFILDVRQPEEWAEYHVPGSTLIPLSELAARSNEVPKDREVVVVCRSGNRSATGRDILIKAGFTQVTSLKGGLSGWKTAGYPTLSDK